MRSVKVLSNLMLLLVLLSIALNSVAAQQSKKELDEASRLNEKADKLYQAGRYDEAIPLENARWRLLRKQLLRKRLARSTPVSSLRSSV